jgi:hypothetical protein
MKLIPVLNISVKFISMQRQFDTEMKAFVSEES